MNFPVLSGNQSGKVYLLANSGHFVMNAVTGELEINPVVLSPFPVNSFYIQIPSVESNTKATAFPTADEPATLFGGTWTQIYEDEGIFFRTEGDIYSQTSGENNNRTNGMQTDLMQGHLHWNGVCMTATTFFVNTTRSANPGSEGTGSSGSGYEGKTSAEIDDLTNGTPRVGKEIRPLNRLIKVWRRTA